VSRVSTPHTLACALLLCAGACAAGQATPDPTGQQKLAKALGAKVHRFQMRCDDSGDVAALVFINHPMYRRKRGEKRGIDDADMARLPSFPRLRMIHIERQPVSDAGVAVLRQFPDLEHADFHYMNSAFKDAGHPGRITPDFILAVNGCRKLRVLEVKHNFALRGTSVHKLEGFPELRRLILDNDAAGPRALDLIARCPKITDLQLHRTTLTDAQFARLVGLVPDLEVLWLKPAYHLKPGERINHRSLRHLKALGKLRILSLQHRAMPPLPFDDGLGHLVAISSLERLELTPDVMKAVDPAALTRFRAARPNLVVTDSLTRFRRYDY